jgi:hypothetical protein
VIIGSKSGIVWNRIGKRSGVWAVPEIVEEAEAEFEICWQGIANKRGTSEGNMGR